MGPVRKYKVTQNGYETVLKLNDADVKLYPDAVPVDDPEPDTGEREGTTAKARRPANKARTAANKTS